MYPVALSYRNSACENKRIAQKGKLILIQKTTRREMSISEHFGENLLPENALTSQPKHEKAAAPKSADGVLLRY